MAKPGRPRGTTCTGCGEPRDTSYSPLCKRCGAKRQREYTAKVGWQSREKPWASLSVEEKAKRQAATKRWREKNPERYVEGYRNARITRKFGITVGEYDAMKARQDSCSICGSQPDILYLDHDHDTGALREFLCQNCNQGLGKFQDDIGLLDKAKSYLVKHRKGQTETA